MSTVKFREVFIDSLKTLLSLFAYLVVIAFIALCIVAPIVIISGWWALLSYPMGIILFIYLVSYLTYKFESD